MPQTFIVSSFWKLEIKDQSYGKFGSFLRQEKSVQGLTLAFGGSLATFYVPFLQKPCPSFCFIFSCILCVYVGVWLEFHCFLGTPIELG